jgi:thioredoxin-like negative regulator of GroEL
MIRIEDENGLTKQLHNTNGMLLVNVWADWSIQCHNMSDVMQNIKILLDDKDDIAYVDWQHQKGLAKKLEVFGVPTLIIYFSGEEVARFSGTMSEVVLLRHIGTAKNKADGAVKG